VFSLGTHLIIKDIDALISIQIRSSSLAMSCSTRRCFLSLRCPYEIKKILCKAN
jgi:hypothetical protein